MIDDLNRMPDRTDIIIEKVFSRGAEHTYLSDIKLPDLDFSQRKEIEACFVATILRYKLLQTPLDLRDTSMERERFRQSLRSEYADFMQSESGNDTELTWLFRFERAILFAKSYINGNRNKGLLLLVGNLLEGSDDFTRYMTGGLASKETKRRVLLIEHLCEIKPRKRTRKLAAGPLQKRIEDEQDNNNNTLHQFADVALLGGIGDFSLLGFTTVSEVSLKILSKHCTSLYSREVELMKRFNNPGNILKMVDFADGNQIENKFIVYETGSYRTICDLIGEGTQILISAMNDLTEAVQFVHDHQLLLRVVKPEHVYLTGPRHNLTVKLGDFTHATRIDLGMLESDDNEDDLLLQDGLFAAPELFSERIGGLNYKADVWSVGMIGLFVFGGYLPWKEVIEVQERIDRDDIGFNQLTINGIIDRLPQDEVAISFLRDSLQISATERKSVLEVLYTLKKHASSLTRLQNCGGSTYLQSQGPFIMNINAAVAVQKFQKTLELESSNGFEINSSFGFARREMSARVASALPASEGKYLKAFRHVVNIATAAGRIQKSNSLPTIIATFSVKTDYSCHIVWNNKTKTKQIMKQIKVKSAQYDNEYSILRTLNNHPAISQLLDYVEGQYQRYMMLERLDDGWLLDLMNVPLSLSSQSQSQSEGIGGSDVMKAQWQPVLKESCIQSIAKSLVSAVDYMHSKGIIHRGLNLSSILMKRVSEDEIKIKIWDFHTAIMKESSYPYSYGPSFSSSLYSSATSTAWAHYPEDDEEGYYCVAPEILRNMVYPDKKEMYDEKADYWSVGMILYILAEGKSCFSLRDPALILRDISLHASIDLHFGFIGDQASSIILGFLRYLPNERVWLTARHVSGWLKIDPPPFLDRSPSEALIQSSFCNSGKDASNVPINASFPSFPFTSSLPASLRDPNSANSSSFPFSSKPSSLSASPFYASPSSITTEQVSPFKSPFKLPAPDSFQLPPPVSLVRRVEETVRMDSLDQVMSSELFKHREYYSVYFKYQKALTDDQLDEAMALNDQLMKIDPWFAPSFEQKASYQQAYQNQLLIFTTALEEFKKVAMKNPRLFKRFKELNEIKKELEKTVPSIV